MAKSWIVDSKGIAKKVRHASLPSGVQIKDCGAKRECPKCHHWIDNSDVSYEWPGLPAGVKFDPSDSQLLEHLAAKSGAREVKPHAFIDEFIPTLEMDKGICYTHPQDLPGATKDGNSIHFFHKTSNAYASGQRKRRKIHNEQNQENVRWHKTGKTKPVYDNGVQKGCKKIMVLYKSSEKGSKPVKSNWVMHQYHLGSEDDEKDDAFVVSKIFYQQSKQTETEDNGVAATDDSNAVLNPYCPKTPKIVTPNPPRGSSAHCDDALDDNVLAAAEDTTCAKVESCITPSTSYMGNVDPPELAGESQVQDPGLNDFGLNDFGLNDFDESLLCKEIFSSCAPLDDTMSLNDLDDYCQSYGISNFDNIHLDSELQFADLLLGSQDSVLNWVDKP
ncbi:SUPPRESSOR OF GAMMA RESPONSE 1-like [Chenopodium quinoa]|uniref:NAC domain-containing protein n=1 Tax=Chenopodium quinoa TaxID=63459 RepID=A0A803KZW2_CHEQI|nr:SUPPRESSOR OF GAMMA RESPONSE 1-like [Chenopodium quinoa]